MGKLKLTLISDTHGKHSAIGDDLTGGDVLIHAGDISRMGYVHEVKNFLGWFDNISGYEHKIFIAGNHDYLFEQQPQLAERMVDEYRTITYLKDSSVEIYDDTYENKIKIYGSPYQPWFHNWAFNLPRNGEELEAKWNEIPDDVDILVTHGPVHQILDETTRESKKVGCEKLQDVIFKKSPKIHVCGHVHEARGWVAKMDTHFFNASVLDLQYDYTNKPFDIEWEYETNSIKFDK